MSEIGILGAGTWGMALARMLYNSGHAVTVWSAIPAEVEQLRQTRRQANLPDMVIPDGIAFTQSVAEVCTGRELLLFVVPSVYVRSTARAAAPFVPAGQLVADAAKGIEPDTLMTMTEILKQEIPGIRAVALSGPTHAEEVARDLPTTVASASEDMEAAERTQDIFMNTCMRVYTNRDVKGVELCGALKNIMALAAGISEGLGYGDNTKAALITRGLAEMVRLGDKMNCERNTFSGLAGMGDLIVTATSRHSRNNRCGELIGRGVKPEAAVKQVGMVVEGINAIPATIALSEKYGVSMPITEAVRDVVLNDRDPGDAVMELMTRDRKAE